MKRSLPAISFGRVPLARRAGAHRERERARPGALRTLATAVVVGSLSWAAAAQDTTHNGSLSIVTTTPVSTTSLQLSGLSSAQVAPAFPTAFSGPTATGTGVETVTMSGNAACVARVCGLSEASLQGVAAAPQKPPAGVSFPHGVFSGVIGNCTPGTPIVIRFTFPAALPGDTKFYLYGPTSDNRAAHWYTAPATINGDTVQATLTDGGVGDQDPDVDGVMVILAGPGVTSAPAIFDVPGLNRSGLSALAALLLLAGLWRIWRNHTSRLFTALFALLLVAAIWELGNAIQATAQTTGAPIQATPGTLGFASQTQGSVSVPKATTLQNVSASPVTIASISIQGEFAQTNDCGNTLSPGQMCSVAVRFAPTACAPSAPPPVLVSANPPSLLASGQTQAIVLTGQNFVAGSLVLFDGTAISPSAQASTTLSLSVPGNLLATAHNASVQVRNPDNQVSTVIQVPVVASSALVLTAVNPNSVQAYGVAHVVTLNGQGFAPGATAVIGGNTLNPQTVAATTMDVEVPGVLLSAPVVLPVLVRNPDGTASNSLVLTVVPLGDQTLPGPDPIAVKILDPLDGANLSALQIPVSGSFVGAEKVVLSNACTPAQLAGSTFSVAAYPLVFGDNVITALATGKNGARATDSVIVHNANPVVMLTLPQEIDDDSVLASGTYQGPPNSRVTVNGLEARVNGSTYYVLVPLTSGANAIQATVITPQAKTHSVSTTIIDTLPMLRIDAPQPAAELGADHVTVSGIFAATSTPSITVNGVPAALSGNAFTAQNIPLKHGRNALVAKTLSPTGRTVMRTITVTNIVPSVTITSPADGATISATTVNVIGVVTGKQGPAGEPTTVSVNGITASRSGMRGPYINPPNNYSWPDGSSFLIQDYTATIPLTAGANTIVVTANSPNGKSTTKAIVVQRPATVIAISMPADSAVVYNDSVIVTGIVDSTSPVTVSVNGVAATLNGSVFAARAPLVLGMNTITATSVAGSATASATLHLTRVEPTVSIASPISGGTVASARILVTGSFQGPAGTSVAVNGSIAVLSGNTFYANNVPLPGGSSNVTATVVTPEGRSATQTIAVNGALGRPDIIEVMADPAEGIAPETIHFLLRNNSGSPITRVEIDSKGSGTADVVATGPVNVVNVPYATPGTYLAKITVTNAAGTQTTATQVVHIVSMDEIDGLLRAIYDQMLTRLRAKDVTGALYHVTGASYAKYSRVFNFIGNQLPSAVDKLGTLQSGSINGDVAEYVLVRDSADTPQVFLIYFLRGEDGVWRIDSM